MSNIKFKINKILFFLLLFAFVLSNISEAKESNATINVIAAPTGSYVPDVVMDANGILHMIYAKNNNAYYVRSTNNGATFTLPVKINTTGSVEYKMGERGPKLAVGTDGVIHVAWMDLWASGVNTHARYTRSINGGLSFEAPKAVSTSTGIDGVTVAADGNNHVFVFWHIMVPVQTQIPEATWLHMARSQNNGATFTVDTNVIITNHSGLACSMCMMRARIGSDGKIYLVFRSAENNIRDFYVLKGDVTSNNFSAVRVNSNNWNIDFCPMVGPELTITPGGQQLCAFMNDYRSYWSISDTPVNAFSLHVATPLNEINEIYPSAIANNSGQVLFVWQVGPMSVSDSATVKWALYNIDGSYTGQHGTVGRTFSGTKTTTYVGTDDNFYIVANVPPTATSINNSEINCNAFIVIDPVNSQLKMIINTTKSKKMFFEIYSITGQLIIDRIENLNSGKNEINCNLNNLAKGVYIVKASNSNGFIFEQKFVR